MASAAIFLYGSGTQRTRYLAMPANTRNQYLLPLVPGVVELPLPIEPLLEPLLSLPAPLVVAHPAEPAVPALLLVPMPLFPMPLLVAQSALPLFPVVPLAPLLPYAPVLLLPVAPLVPLLPYGPVTLGLVTPAPLLLLLLVSVEDVCAETAPAMPNIRNKTGNFFIVLAPGKLNEMALANRQWHMRQRMNVTQMRLCNRFSVSLNFKKSLRISARLDVPQIANLFIKLF